MVYAEALAAGLPVLAFEPSAVADFVNRDNTGLVGVSGRTICQPRLLMPRADFRTCVRAAEQRLTRITPRTNSRVERFRSTSGLSRGRGSDGHVVCTFTRRRGPPICERDNSANVSSDRSEENGPLTRFWRRFSSFCFRFSSCTSTAGVST